LIFNHLSPLARLGTPLAMCKVSGGKEAMKEEVEPAEEKKRKG